MATGYQTNLTSLLRGEMSRAEAKLPTKGRSRVGGRNEPFCLQWLAFMTNLSHSKISLSFRQARSAQNRHHQLDSGDAQIEPSLLVNMLLRLLCP